MVSFIDSELKSKEICEKICKKYQEEMIDTKDTLQRIVVKPFELKNN